MLRQALLPLLLAAVAVRGAANLPPLQSKLSNVIKDVEGLASDRARVEDNIKTLKKSGLDRLQGALTNPVMQVGWRGEGAGRVFLRPAPAPTPPPCSFTAF